jgi:hypothetical protein
MRSKPNFDEVMIVNPAEPGANEGVRFMRFYPADQSATGYYTEVPGPYGYYGDMPEAYGYYGEQPEPYYGQVPEAYYGQVPEAYYGQVPEAYYGQVPEPYGYYSQTPEPSATYGEVDPTYPGYGEMPEMPGYAEYAPQQEYPGVAYYGDPYFAGYTRAGRSAFNAGCPMPTNVAGVPEAEPLEGYVRPSSVNATCDQMTPQAGTGPFASDLFKPLW